MHYYVLLRNNKQEGPYSFEELIERKLRNLDLVWKEGDCSYWLYPFEMEELKPFIHIDDSAVNELKGNGIEPVEIPNLKIRFQQPLDVLKKKYHDHNREKKIRFHQTAIHISTMMAAVFAGLFLVGVFTAKNRNEAKSGKNVSPVSFHTPALSEGSVPDQPVNRHIQNALVTELVVDNRNDELKRKKLHDHWKKQVTIKANDYTSAEKEGIRDLYLTIENKTSVFLRNVKVQVDYLNGENKLINSQVITIKNIPARSERSWKMRDTGKGVKVQYKVLDIFSKKKPSIFFDA